MYIGRPGPWGNPFKMKDKSVAERKRVIEEYRHWLHHTEAGKAKAEIAKAELKGKTLACHCSPLACHGDVLAECANSE